MNHIVCKGARGSRSQHFAMRAEARAINRMKFKLDLFGYNEGRLYSHPYLLPTIQYSSDKYL
jgi:hypothetical protein